MPKPPHNQRGRNPVPQQQPQPQQQISVSQQMQWSGPLPPPAALERFNQIIPNGADRIVKMAEAEQAHRHEYEKTGVVASANEARRGQFLGAFISVLAISGAIFTAYIGAPASVPIGLVSVTILGIINAIVRPRK